MACSGRCKAYEDHAGQSMSGNVRVGMTKPADYGKRLTDGHGSGMHHKRISVMKHQLDMLCRDYSFTHVLFPRSRFHKAVLLHIFFQEAGRLKETKMHGTKISFLAYIRFVFKH